MPLPLLGSTPAKILVVAPVTAAEDGFVFIPLIGHHPEIANPRFTLFRDFLPQWPVPSQWSVLGVSGSAGGSINAQSDPCSQATGHPFTVDPGHVR